MLFRSQLRQGCALFPNVAKDGSFTLPPGELTRVFWDLRANACEPKTAEMSRQSGFCAIDGLCENSIRGGQYKVVLNLLFTEIDGKESHEHSASKNLEVRVVSPFGWILCWSIVGGLCAYWVKAFVNLGKETTGLREKVFEFLTWQNILALLGNGALSGVLVVIGTQLADTAFPIKVDASSVIGAFTSGFVLNFAGQRVITWLGTLK